MFLEKDFEGALESFQSLSSFVRQHRDKRNQATTEGEKIEKIPTIPPCIAVLGRVIDKIAESNWQVN